MSLKNFHLLFVTAATLLALFCAVQAFEAYRAAGTLMMAVASMAALAAAVLLVGVERAFLRRCREEGVR